MIPKSLFVRRTLVSLVPLTAAAHLACSASRTITEGPYAGCEDLGDLALSSSSRDAAEQRMKAQVLDLGGDTLLFGERGRDFRIDVPEEITERRNELVRSVESERGAAGDQSGADQAPPPAGELWYYGAALRCN
jgi:hypothetical protein